MRKSKTRRRVAVKTAAIAAAGAGILFGAMPAIASISAAAKPVHYKCTVGGTGSEIPYLFQMDLTGPAAATPNGPLVATWKIGTPAPAVTASTNIPVTGRLIVEADTVLAGTPLPSPLESRVVEATAAAASATVGQPLTPPPMLITVTPKAAGAVTIQPGGFTLYLNAGTGAGAVANDVELIDCLVATPAEVTAAALVINVQTPSTSPPVTPPATPPVPTVSPTVTITKTETSEPVPTRQIDKTPAGAASTGGGGDAGPDARLIMLSGALMVAFAEIGGLVLRRRTAIQS